jgi:hypothetical protein
MITTVLLVGFLVTAAVLIHYEMLYRLATLLPEKADKHRYHVLVGVLGSLCAHVIEIWLFAFGYYFMISSGAFGTLQGNFTNTLRDCGYFSFTTYSTLGVGDIEPVGHVRFLVGLESLTGLVLITWTASFVFVEMQKFWEHK